METRNLQKELYAALFKADLEREKYYKNTKQLSIISNSKGNKVEIKQLTKDAKANLDASNRYLKFAVSLIPEIIIEFESSDEIKQKQTELTEEENTEYYQSLLKAKTKEIAQKINKKGGQEAYLEYYFLWETTNLKLKEQSEEFYVKLISNKTDIPAVASEVSSNVLNPETVVATVTGKNSFEEKLVFAYKLFVNNQFSAALNSLEEVIAEYSCSGRILLLYLMARSASANVNQLVQNFENVDYYDVYLRAIKMVDPSAYREYRVLLLAILKKAIIAMNHKDVACAIELLSRTGVVDTNSQLDFEFKQLCMQYYLETKDDVAFGKVASTVPTNNKIVATSLTNSINTFLIQKDFLRARKVLAIAKDMQISDIILHYQATLVAKSASTFSEYPIKKKEYQRMISEYIPGNDYIDEAIAESIASLFPYKKALLEIEKQKEKIVPTPKIEAMMIAKCADRLLRNRKFKQAAKGYQKALDLDKTCKDANVGLLLVDYKCTKIEQLLSKKVSFRTNEYYLALGTNNVIEKQLRVTNARVTVLDKQYKTEYIGRIVGVVLFLASVALSFVNYFVFAILFALACGAPQLFKLNIKKGIIKFVIITIIIGVVLIVPYIIFKDMIMEFIDDLLANI